MAEYDPSFQGGTWDGGDVEEGFDGTPREAQHSSEQDEDDKEDQNHDQEQDTEDREQADLSHVPDLHDHPGDPLSSRGASEEEEDAGDYDPTSVMVASPVAPSIVALPLQPSPLAYEQHSVVIAEPPSQLTVKKPRTAGGFLVGDSDDEDDMLPSTALSGDRQGPGPFSQNLMPMPSPLKTSVVASQPNNTVAQAHKLPTLQANTTAEASAPEGPALTANGLNGGVTAGSTPVSALTAGSARQVPQDKVVVLEERVREDPRGAMDAWLGLMAEHRARDDYDAARQVYGRFLETFPQSVRRALFTWTVEQTKRKTTDILSRLISWSRSLTWNSISTTSQPPRQSLPSISLRRST